MGIRKVKIGKRVPVANDTQTGNFVLDNNIIALQFWKYSTMKSLIITS